MSVSEASDEDLTQDSVPDPPRENITDTPVTENGHDKSDKSRKVKKESSPKPSKPSKPKRSPWRLPDFGMAHGPAPTTTINIQAASNVHVGNVFNINVGQKKNKPSVEKPSEVRELMTSCEVVSRDDIDTVASHTGKGWMDLGKNLGLSEGQLTQIEHDNEEDGLKEMVYQMLLSWKQDKDTKATVGYLCKCLWKSREYDAAKMLAKERSSR